MGIDDLGRMFSLHLGISRISVVSSVGVAAGVTTADIITAGITSAGVVAGGVARGVVGASCWLGINAVGAGGVGVAFEGSAGGADGKPMTSKLVSIAGRDWPAAANCVEHSPCVGIEASLSGSIITTFAVSGGSSCSMSDIVSGRASDADRGVGCGSSGDFGANSWTASWTTSGLGPV